MLLIHNRKPMLAVLTALQFIHHAQSATLLWSEEFNGTALDANVWTPRTGNNNGWGNGELQYYTEANVAIADQEYLSITVLKELDSNGTVTFTSARIDTKDKVHVLYGTISALIQIPNVDAGLWPAFWTLGAADLEFPALGEMDIMETGEGLAISQGLANRRVVSGAHWEKNGSYATLAGSRDLDFDLNTTFVSYTLDWTPTNITTYVNDFQVWTMNTTEEGGCIDCEEFHAPHYMVLNVAVGGGFTSSGGSSGSSASSGCGGSSGSSGSSGACGALRTPENITAPLPATMRVDWVRIYDNGGGSVNVTTPTTPDAPTPAVVVPAPVSAPTASVVATAPSADAGFIFGGGKGSGKGSGKGKSSKKGSKKGKGSNSDSNSALEFAASAAPGLTTLGSLTAGAAAFLAIAQLQ